MHPVASQDAVDLANLFIPLVNHTVWLVCQLISHSDNLVQEPFTPQLLGEQAEAVRPPVVRLHLLLEAHGLIVPCSLPPA